MKTKLCLLIFILAAAFARAQTNNLTALLQQGLFEEQANRNLDAAISDYQTLATQFDKDRQLAATAIFRLGECYRIQGKTNEAALEYIRIVNEFSDQTTLATLSLQNLTGLGAEASKAASAENSDAALWDKVKNLQPSELEKVLPTLAPDAVLTSLLQQRNAAETKLAELNVTVGSANPDVVTAKAVLDEINKQISEKMDGIMQALKMRAEISVSPAVAISVPTDAEDQEIQRIQQMIQNSPDLINAPSGNDSKTPLERAASNGWLKVAAYLLDHGAEVNLGMPLYQATQAGNRAMVEFLASRGANVNSKNSQGETPLQVAVRRQYQSVIEVLLANKADVNTQDNSGVTPLLLAAQRDNSKIVSMLLEQKAMTDPQSEYGTTPLCAAAEAGKLENVKLLLAAGANVNVEKNDRTPLNFATESGSPEMVKILLDAKANPNGGTLDEPLLAAIHAKDTNSAELLLEAGANPDAVGEIDFSSPPVFLNGRSIQPAGGFGNSPRSVAPLWLAISENQLPMVQLLLKFKADPNDSQTDDRSLLFSALSDTNILEVLLDAGAKVDAMGFSSNVRVGNSAINLTPLDEAVRQNNAAAVETLLKHGANPNIRDPIGSYTPLHWAANFLADRKIFELLLAYKAERNVRDESGQTPLDMLKEEAKTDNLATDFAGKKKAGDLADLLR